MNHTPSVSVRNIVLGEGIPKICIPLVSTCLDALLNDMKKALQTDLQSFISIYLLANIPSPNA